MAEPLLEVRGLEVRYALRKGVFAQRRDVLRAVAGVSFELARGETLGVVGESGSGKSTIARAIVGLVKPSAGEIILRGRFGMVFQDPLGSLNPRLTIRATLTEALGGRGDPLALLKSVGLDAAALDKFPHAFSGGERQRICIARALAGHPDLLICDEAVSALDLSIRAQILDLLSGLKRKLDLTMLFITHDLGVVQHVADRLLVLKSGKLVESGLVNDIIRHPQAEYTQRLLASVPRLNSSFLPQDARNVLYYAG